MSWPAEAGHPGDYNTQLAAQTRGHWMASSRKRGSSRAMTISVSIPVESHVDRDGNAIAVAGEGMHLMLDPSRKCEHHSCLRLDQHRLTRFETGHIGQDGRRGRVAQPHAAAPPGGG